MMRLALQSRSGITRPGLWVSAAPRSVDGVPTDLRASSGCACRHAIGPDCSANSSVSTSTSTSGRGRRRPPSPVSTASHGSPSNTPRSEATLQAKVPRDIERWQAVSSWLVFSDLHVSPTTLDTCLGVLRAVREEAAARGAGVLFLGDFWHHRGSLPVEPLNAVLDEFSRWTAPTLMLVGNHDQVTAGGLTHALRPLEACCPSVHVMDQPTEFLGALWLPYRRDPEELREAIKMAADPKAIFAHVDVVGAYMNETFQARDGVRPELFPTTVPTYTGHYHRRHTVEGSSIHYVGSPYQVSRSEAGQSKALTLLDSSWQPLGEVPIDVGPRFFLLSGEAAASQEDAVAAVRSGDRVRVMLSEQRANDGEQALISQLQESGARLEVLSAPVAASARIKQAEELGAVPLFVGYAEATGLGAGARKAGLAILQDLQAAGLRMTLENTQLELHSLEVRGFGPFAEQVTYPLSGRGLQVVVGSNRDDSGADSNGAGKTALVMAPQWVLTGRMDNGRDGGGGRATTHADVVSDSVKSAHGKVEGSVNGKPFTVERSVTRRALSKLRFHLDGEDVTQADSRMTQTLIDSTLNSQLLARTAFFSQNAVSALLVASDRDFKAELSKVVDLDVWETAKEKSSALLKETKAASARLEGQVEAGASMLERLQGQLLEARLAAEQWEAQRAARLDATRTQRNTCARRLGRQGSECAKALQAIRDWQDKQHEAGHSSHNGQPGEPTDPPRKEQERLLGLIERQEVLVSATERVLEKAREHYRQRDQELRSAEAAAAEQLAAARIARLGLEEYRQLRQTGGASEDGSTAQAESHSHDGALVCDRCLQPIDTQAFASNVQRLEDGVADVQALADGAGRNVEALAAARHRAAGGVEEAEQDLKAHQRALQELSGEQQAERMARMEADHERQRRMQQREALLSAAERAAGVLAATLQQIRVALEGSSQDASDGSDEVSAGAQQQGEATGDQAEIEVLYKEAQELVSEARRREQEYNQLQREVSELELREAPHTREVASLERLVSESQATLQGERARLEEGDLERRNLEEVDKAFGRTGIPSYVLEGVLAELQAVTAEFLEGMGTGFLLSLSPTTEKSKAGAAPSEQISKLVQVRLPSGEVVDRSLRQLSGGEQRRVALALGLGFSRLAAVRGCFDCNVLVLDEVLQHLDNEGCAAVASVLQSLPQDTVLLVGQDNTFATENFDAVDVVIKEGGRSRVEERAH